MWPALFKEAQQESGRCEQLLSWSEKPWQSNTGAKNIKAEIKLLSKTAAAEPSGSAVHNLHLYFGDPRCSPLSSILFRTLPSGNAHCSGLIPFWGFGVISSPQSAPVVMAGCSP
ncbi:hypothetical protein UY3_03484 [Chelonia mydas]|uniref:Uncharacterized protein n=1 Tax=Chelonia mydas TaxID=8469 RepID=M7BN66_CHEMY|nr:hypothetical protein UY3_03484 [Chelonia mydas]